MRRHEIITVLIVLFTCLVFRPGKCCPTDWLAFDTQCIRILNTEISAFTAHLTCLMKGGIRVDGDMSGDMKNFLAIRTHSYSPNAFWVATPASGRSRYNVCYIFTNGSVEPTSCLGEHGVICSLRTTLQDPVENCLVGLTEHSFVGENSGRCIFRTPGAAKRVNANSKCNEYGGILLNLNELLSEGLTAFHEHRVMMDDGVKYWTHLKMNGSNAMWENGEPLQDFFSFVPGRGECVTVSFNFTDTVNAVVYQTECEDHAYAICASVVAVRSTTLTVTSTTPQAPLQQLQVTSCPEGNNWRVYNGFCYWETSFETSRLSWDDARSYCQAFGGDLASFHSQTEERIGLSFQYGSLAHPYWIGLKLDLDTETYKWSDGSPLDYENWAVGHPNHQDKRLQCVSFDAQNTRWKSSLCGVISWFICRVAKMPNPPAPVVPTPTPLPVCDESYAANRQFYFEGYCYSVVNTMHTWHRAKEYCENEGSSLVSIHSDQEIGFLLRMLYDDKNTRGNRVWIGLNTLRSGTLKWTDYSPVDFTYWNLNEPNNMRNVEKCCSMYIGNGLWNDEICNEKMGFVCKQYKNATDTHVIPSTPDPRIGNCKKGWYEHHDRCYLPVGYSEKDRVNWTEASTFCERAGGNLVSIRNLKEQAFVSYLMQGLRDDAWIGLHDTIHSGRYYWLDNIDIQYTNWAPGEPSFFGIQEDCVKMVYNDINSGVWRDDVCSKKLPFICYAEKDLTIPKPDYNRGLSCIYPEGWLKLGDMCFRMSAGNPANWQDAESACNRDGAHLVSLSHNSVQAVATYLGVEVNQTYWIGLEYKKSTKSFGWLNDWPATVTRWRKREPEGVPSDNLCYASTFDGYWGKRPCDEELPYICQITAGKPPVLKQYTGNCPPTSEAWIPTGGSYCHLYSSSRASWFEANMRCFILGSYLISIHSLADLDALRKEIKPDMRSLYIGLMPNDKEGFSWIDQSPVDFVNWDEGQPENDYDNCVEMMADTLKWRVTPCLAVKNFVCSAPKDQLINGIPENSRYISGSSSGLSTAAITAILACAFLVLVFLIGAAFFLRPSLGRSAFSMSPFARHHNSVSYENALYNVDSACMEFQEDGKDSL